MGSTPTVSKKLKNIKKTFTNNQIRAREVRVIDETGKQLGILPLDEAIHIAKDRGFDLVQITDKTDPPVCKIIEYGKYLYSLQKKERKTKTKSSEVKGVRLSLGISSHDLETKANSSKKFLKQGNRVKIEMKLRGREKAHQELAKEKIQKFIEIIKEEIPIKEEGQIKKEPKGLTLIIGKQ